VVILERKSTLITLRIAPHNYESATLDAVKTREAMWPYTRLSVNIPLHNVHSFPKRSVVANNQRNGEGMDSYRPYCLKAEALLSSFHTLYAVENSLVFIGQSPVICSGDNTKHIHQVGQ